MKKFYYTVLLLLFLPLFLLAQPTITQDWVGEPGDVTSTVRSEVIPDISPSGENAYWDFTDVLETQYTMRDGEFLSVESTPFSGSFPDANVCLREEYFGGLLGVILTYQYGYLSENVVELQGRRDILPIGEAPILWMDYSDPRTMLSFPFTFGSVDDDTYKGASGSLFDIFIYTEGSVHYEGDSYGVVDLPNGKFENCLRVAFSEMVVDSIDAPMYTRLSTSEIAGYMWVNPDKPGNLAYYRTTISTEITYREGESPETEITYDTIFTYNPLVTVAVTEPDDESAFDVQVSPNPFLGYVNIEYELELASEGWFKVFTSNGQLVYARKMQGTKGSNNFQVDLGDLIAGNYIGVLQSGSNTATMRLVKVE